MKGRGSRFGILGIVFVMIIIGGLTFHHLRNRPFAVMGYYPTNANGTLKDIGNHFDKNGMLEVEFHYKAPTGDPNVVYTDHYTYTVLKDGSGEPLLKNATFVTSKGTRPSRSQWVSCRFPIAQYPNDLKLSPGKYHVNLYLNGIQIDSATFYVDKPMVAYSDTTSHQ